MISDYDREELSGYKCECCGEPILVGEDFVHCLTGASFHADCMGLIRLDMLAKYFNCYIDRVEGRRNDE